MDRKPSIKIRRKNIEKMISKIDHIFKKCINQIFLIIGIIVIFILAFIFMYHKYLISQEKNAATVLFHGQNYFSHQQWEKALHGNGLDYIGFLGIINEFSGTKISNLAKAYAGICFYQLENYKEAIRFLKSYCGKDQLFAAQVIGAIGDCEINLGNIKEGIMYFQKAAVKAKSLYLSPIYLKKAAIAYESLKNYRWAMEIYTSILALYPKSSLSYSIKKHINRLKSEHLISSSYEKKFSGI